MLAHAAQSRGVSPSEFIRSSAMRTTGIQARAASPAEALATCAVITSVL
jgi:hypothetical protein